MIRVSHVSFMFDLGLDKPLSNLPIEYTALLSGINDSYSVKLKFKSVDNTATNHQIGANATFYGLTPNGTECSICTTLQYYGYKPSSAATLLMANKTPENWITNEK